MPGRLHVDQQEGQALVLRRPDIGAHQQDAPVREAGVAGPDLLPGDVEDVAVAGRRACGTRPGRSRRSGSEKPWHQTSSPVRIFGRKRRFCSSVPWWISVGPVSPGPTPMSIIGGAPSRVYSSANRNCSMGVAPRPPYSFGQCRPAQPPSWSAPLPAARERDLLRRDRPACGIPAFPSPRAGWRATSRGPRLETPPPRRSVGSPSRDGCRGRRGRGSRTPTRIAPVYSERPRN